jgi:hypothetical protein
MSSTLASTKRYEGFPVYLENVDVYPRKVSKGKCSTANAAGERGVPAIKNKSPSLEGRVGMGWPKSLTIRNLEFT